MALMSTEPVPFTTVVLSNLLCTTVVADDAPFSEIESATDATV